jgi:hypothetical protein
MWVFWFLAAALGIVVGFTAALLVLPRRWDSGSWEALGTWVSAVLSAAILVVLAIRPEKLARAQADGQAEHEANLIECGAAAAKADVLDKDDHGNPEMVLVREIVFFAQNNSNHIITGVSCHVPLHGIGSIGMPNAIPRRQAAEQISVPKAFMTDPNLREINESAEFRFTLGGLRWSKRHQGFAIRN